MIKSELKWDTIISRVMSYVFAEAFTQIMTVAK